MNRRFSLKIEYGTKGDYGWIDYKILKLQLRVPYKIFNKTKYTYITVYETGDYELPINIKTQSQIMNFLVNEFEKKRKMTLINRIINRIEKLRT